MTLIISTGGIAKNPIGVRPGSLAALLQDWSAPGGFLFDFTRLAGLYQDIAGTVPVTGVGQPVGFARNLSGNGLDAYAEDDEARPLLAEDANGVLCIDCGAQERRLRVDFASSTSFQVRSILTAAHHSGNNSFALRSLTGSASNNVATLGITAAGPGSRVQIGTGGAEPMGRSITDYTVPYIFSGRSVSGDPGHQLIHVDGESDVDEAWEVVANSTNGALIGGRPSSAMKGLIYGVAWSPSDIDLEPAEQYFAGRIGIELAA